MAPIVALIGALDAKLPLETWSAPMDVVRREHVHWRSRLVESTSIGEPKRSNEGEYQRTQALQ